MRYFITIPGIILLSTILNTNVLVGQKTNYMNSNKKQVIISALQMNVTTDINENKKNIIEGIRKASPEGSAYLATPEGSLSGYTSKFNQNEVDAALSEIISSAKKLKVGLILGTCYKESVKGSEICYNQVRVYDPDGSFQGVYSKILRCSNMDFPGTGEMVDYAEGELKIFSWEGVKFGILICNDLWATPGYTTMANPYLAWKLKQMGAQFIVHCINSGTDQRYRPFHESSAELWAFSMKIPILEVNAAHDLDKINAGSGLIDAKGDRCLKVPDSGLQFFTAKIQY
jgi:predicted amidohydrolase